MYRRIQITLPLVMLTLASCSPPSNLISQTATSSSLPATLAPTPTKSPTPTVTLPQIPTQMDSDLLIIMKREGCYLICPIYQLAIESNGNITYEGLAFVEVEGIRKAWINSREVAKLITAIEEADFFELEDNYVPIFLDVERLTISITLDGHSKSIRHFGIWCGDEPKTAPPKLCELENLIEEITNSSQWVGQLDYSDYFDQ